MRVFTNAAGSIAVAKLDLTADALKKNPAARAAWALGPGTGPRGGGVEAVYG